MKRDNRKVFWVLLVCLMVIDQLIKRWARNTFGDNQAAMGHGPFPGIFEFTLTFNKGIAFGILQGHGILLAPVAMLMAGFAIYYSTKHATEPLLHHVALGLLAAGALGNLLDRLVHGEVTDMFYFRIINFPVFNFADACITISAILIAISVAFESKQSPVQQSSADSTPEPVV